MRIMREPARRRAAWLGMYLSAAIAALTRSRVAVRTLVSPLTTRETVIGETPARRATSAMVAAVGLRPRVFAFTFALAMDSSQVSHTTEVKRAAGVGPAALAAAV